MEVIELKHPLVEHKLAILRDKKTGTKEFREIVSELATMLCYEAMKDAKMHEVEIETPMQKMKTRKINEDNYAFPEALNGGHKEFYQFSRGLRFVVSIPEQKVLEITYEGEPIDDERLFRIGLQRYHLKNLKEFLDVSEEEAAANAPFKILATNAMDVLDETLSHTELVRCPEDQRWITISE